jgi:ribosomal protein RSM22 (predicted rRNA methylase)
MIGVPAAIEEALRAAARRHLPDAVTGGAALTAAVVDRSRRYTSERDRLAAPASPAADLAARALFFTIADAPKAMAALAELGEALRWRGDDPLRLVDLGAGCGAMTLGAIAHAAAVGATRPLEVVAIDRDAGALAILADAVPAAAHALGVAATVTTRRGGLPGAVPPGELILCGSLLNELDAAPALAVVDAAVMSLAADGALIVIEPALRETSRRLHRIRDAVIAAGSAHVFAPCTRRAAPCPMLADERDWCHEERAATLPPVAARLAQNTGLRDGALKYSYLVLRRVPGHVGGPGHVRVVGHPQRSKGKIELPVCGDAGLVTVRLLRRDRTPQAKALERARRGDVLDIGEG